MCHELLQALGAARLSTSDLHKGHHLVASTVVERVQPPEFFFRTVSRLKDINGYLFFCLGLFLAAVCPWSAEAATDKLRAPSLRRAAACGFQPQDAHGARPPAGLPVATRLPCTAAAQGVTGRCAATANRPVQQWPAT